MCSVWNKHLLLVITLLSGASISGLYRNEYPQHKLELRIQAIIDDMLDDEYDVCLKTFVQHRRREIITRCIQRIPHRFFRTDDYCDQDGTINDHVRKQALITRNDFLSGEQERISDLIPVKSKQYTLKKSKKRFTATLAIWDESEEYDDIQ